MGEFRIIEDARSKRRTLWFDDQPITASVLRSLGQTAVEMALEKAGDERLRDALAYMLLHEWAVWARPEQLFPLTEHRTIVALAGRGWGKTRAGGEWVREQIRMGYQHVNLIGPTLDDAREVMIEGESGILALCPKAERPTYVKQERKLKWPNGAVSRVFTADEPERLRGKQHQRVWCDELCAWRYPEAWVQMRLGLRLRSPSGAPVTTPQALVTTTPKNSKLLKDLLARSDTMIVRGKTSDNVANLAPEFFKDLNQQYGGTRLGRQELDAEMLTDNPGALWTYDLIERSRVEAYRVEFDPETGDEGVVKVHRNFRRIVVAIDPPATSTSSSDECGLVVCALGEDGRGYVLEDLSDVMAPSEWGKKAIEAYNRWGADRVVAEVNQGGEMVENTLRTLPGGMNLSYKAVRASKGKFARAEPVSALYEQGRVHHVGVFQALEDQLTDYNPQTSTKSPDRLDAMVWAFTELMIDQDVGLMEHMRQELEKAKTTVANTSSSVSVQASEPVEPEQPAPDVPKPAVPARRKPTGAVPSGGTGRRITPVNRIAALRQRR